jgi:hypothetical protein
MRPITRALVPHSWKKLLVLGRKNQQHRRRTMQNNYQRNLLSYWCGGSISRTDHVAPTTKPHLFRKHILKSQYKFSSVTNEQRPQPQQQYTTYETGGRVVNDADVRRHTATSQKHASIAAADTLQRNHTNTTDNTPDNHNETMGIFRLLKEPARELLAQQRLLTDQAVRYICVVILARIGKIQISPLCIICLYHFAKLTARGSTTCRYTASFVARNNNHHG